MSSSWLRNCFSPFVSLLSRVRINCGIDCSAATIADMDEKFWSFRHSCGTKCHVRTPDVQAGKEREEERERRTSAASTKRLKLVARLFTSSELEPGISTTF